MIDWVGFDGDDTLWHSEDYYMQAKAEFATIVAPWADLDSSALQQHVDSEAAAMLPVYGYGAKGLTLAMVQTAIEVTAGAISAHAIGRIVALGRNLLEHPVALLPGIREVVAAVASRYRIILITKGDLLHQQRKIEASGLADLFQHISIVSDKRPSDYARVLAARGVDAHRFAMIGNSLRSDIEPVVRLGGYGIHQPYHVTWAHERSHGLAADHVRVATATAPADIIPALAAFAAG